MTGTSFIWSGLAGAVLLCCLVAGVQAAVPVADFAANVTSGCAPLTVQFTDLSTGSPTTWFWELRESPSVTTNTQNVTYTYTEPGVHRIYLRVSNVDGEDIEIKDAYITVLPPLVASFTANVSSGHAPLTVQFTDTSAGAPTAWAWDFDGDSVADSTDQHPVYTFAANGTYTVALQVSNAGGTDLESKADFVFVGALTASYLKPSFRYTTAMGTAPLEVSFTDTTWTGDGGGTYARLWDFGDGNTSVEANPTHVYTDPGKFDVELRVTSDTRSAATRISKAVMVYPDQASGPIPTTTFGVHATELAEANFDPMVYGETLPKAYTDLMPIALVWGIIFLGVFAMMFIRQGNVTIILIMGILVGGSIWVLLPPEWNLLGQGMAGLCMAGFLFTLFTGRRK